MKEAARRQTIAERKAAELASAASGNGKSASAKNSNVNGKDS